MNKQVQRSKVLVEGYKQAKKCLNKITLLQEKLNMEEGNLRGLLKVYGLKVLSFDVLA